MTSATKIKAKRIDDIANLVHSQVNQEDVKTLCSEKIDKIKTVNFYVAWNAISYIEISQFSKGQWKNLEALYLHNNKVGDKGCKYLARATIGKFTTLDLRFNQIGSTGVMHLSKGAWKKLKDLNLQVNVVGIDGVLCLVRANWNINTLSLRWNKISLVEARNWMISHSKQLKSISLSNNLIGKENSDHLKKIFNQKSSIDKSSKVKFQISL